MIFPFSRTQGGVLGLFIIVAFGWLGALPDATPSQQTHTLHVPIITNGALYYEWPTVKGERLLNGVLTKPTQVTTANDGSGRLYITEKAGVVRIYVDEMLLATPFLDISTLVGSAGYEQGLLSIAFPPDFASKQHFYLHYTDVAGNSRVERYHVLESDPNRADPSSAELILEVEQPAPSHNGGQLHFGPDGYLYIALGDGADAADPYENAQNLSVLLGKLLRIDVEHQDGAGYLIPSDNPFIDLPDARPEIWAFGLRNPWRFNFDRDTGDLYIGDVGQQTWEEVNHQPVASGGGENYGWDCYEGFVPFEPDGCDDPTLYRFPEFVYSHDDGCSVTLGFIHRGDLDPRMNGVLFYSDYCTGWTFGAVQDGGGNWWIKRFNWSEGLPTSYGEDEDGTLYIVTQYGHLYRLYDDISE